MIGTRHRFGARRSAKVLDVRSTRELGAIVVCGDDHNEGHIIVGHPAPLPQIGAAVTLVFTRGGPVGGYWKVEAQR